MGLQEAELDGDLWCFAHEDSAKVGRIRETPSVDVSLSDTEGHSWTSVSGRAEAVHDLAKAEQLRSPVLKAWFPDELETPGLTLIRIEADSAEHWDAPTSTVACAADATRRDP